MSLAGPRLPRSRPANQREKAQKLFHGTGRMVNISKLYFIIRNECCG